MYCLRNNNIHAKERAVNRVTANGMMEIESGQSRQAI